MSLENNIAVRIGLHLPTLSHKHTRDPFQNVAAQEKIKIARKWNTFHTKQARILITS